LHELLIVTFDVFHEQSILYSLNPIDLPCEFLRHLLEKEAWHAAVDDQHTIITSARNVSQRGVPASRPSALHSRDNTTPAGLNDRKLC
jgi:hypothetical protein